MTESNQTAFDKAYSKRVIDTTIRLGLIALLGYFCLLIFKPFLISVLWGVIVAVAIYPIYLMFESLLGKRKKVALTLFTLVALAILIVPTIMLTSSSVQTAHELAQGLEDGSFRVPPPPEAVADWPLVGEKVHALWNMASSNLAATVDQYAPQIKATGKWLLATAASAGVSVIQFIIAILIAAAFIANAEDAHRFARALAVRLAGDEGKDLIDLAGATMRSVARGVLGVAFIQALLAGIGMLVMGVPGAGLWALLVLLLAVVQLPALLILGPIIVYVFSTAATMPAVIFAVWCLFVGVSDTFLKPMLLGRGLEVPMLVILVGAIGGMIFAGIIGLFVGAVVLALGYKLFIAWMNQGFTAHGDEFVALEKDIDA